jgi:orotate phosphoribosyltransferase-like protein|tara:strand:+ start:377 stop:733 length:357 start_codon:yes stop_codon:yes gene_type:complete
MNIFIREDFISHAGLPLTWKVECDALTNKDYEALAKIVSEKMTFRDVKGIPRGGIPFENALKQYCTNNDNDRLLICDDVYTTGTSMREVYEKDAIGVVVFARNEITDDWIKAIWQLSL